MRMIAARPKILNSEVLTMVVCVGAQRDEKAPSPYINALRPPPLYTCTLAVGG